MDCLDASQTATGAIITRSGTTGSIHSQSTYSRQCLMSIPQTKMCLHPHLIFQLSLFLRDQAVLILTDWISTVTANFRLRCRRIVRCRRSLAAPRQFLHLLAKLVCREKMRLCPLGVFLRLMFLLQLMARTLPGLPRRMYTLRRLLLRKSTTRTRHDWYTFHDTFCDDQL